MAHPTKQQLPLTHPTCCGLQAVLAVSLCALPKEFTGIFTEDSGRVVRNWDLFFCVAVGLWGGLIIGLVTEYFTSNRYQPVRVGCCTRHATCPMQHSNVFLSLHSTVICTMLHSNAGWVCTSLEGVTVGWATACFSLLSSLSKYVSGWSWCSYQFICNYSFRAACS